MNYKKYFLRITSISVIISSFIACSTISFMLWYDYLQIFPKGYFIEEKYQSDMRDQAKGIIDNVDFDSVILGTSLLRASSSKELDVLFGSTTTFMNLSMSSGNFYERSIILDYLLKRKDVKNIVYSFEFFEYYGEDRDRTNGVKWISLYDDNIDNDKYRYEDLNIIKKSVKYFFKQHQTTYADNYFFELQTTSEHNRRYAKKYGGLNNIIENISKKARVSFFERVEKTKNIIGDSPTVLPALSPEETRTYLEYVNRNIIRHVVSSKNTVFHIVLVPLSRYYFAELRQTQPKKYALHKEMNAYIVKMSAVYPNLKVFGFEDMDFLDDISCYADTNHYHQSVNSMMNKAIATGNHLLTAKNIDEYLERCDKLAQEFDIDLFYSDLKQAFHDCRINSKTGEKF